MAKESEERRVPNFIRNEERHMYVKRKRQLIEYQISVFRRERNRIQKRYDHLVETIEDRKKSYKLICDTREELEHLYRTTDMDDYTYMQQRSWQWLVYSDRGAIERLKWLDEMIEEYTMRLEAVDTWRAQQKKETERKNNEKRQKRARYNAYFRKRRRRINSEKRKEEYLIRKERCRYGYR